MLSHLRQPDFIAPLRVVALYRATTGTGLGRLFLGAISRIETPLWFSGGQSLADYYVEDNLDYDYLDHSQFGLHEPDFDTALLDRESEDVEPDDFTGSSPYLLSAQAETILCRYLGDLYSVKDAESREADSQSGGRSSVRSRLFADASLGRESVRDLSSSRFRVRIYASRFAAPVSVDASAGVWCVSFRGR